MNQFVSGIRVSHGDSPCHVTAIGHSYGSTVVGEAALSGRLQVDDVMTAGSPGTHADNARELMADPRRGWAGSADDDPVSNATGNQYSTWARENLGPLGDGLVAAYDEGHAPSPHHEDFGAIASASTRTATVTTGISAARAWTTRRRSL